MLKILGISNICFYKGKNQPLMVNAYWTFSSPGILYKAICFKEYEQVHTNTQCTQFVILTNLKSWIMVCPLSHQSITSASGRTLDALYKVQIRYFWNTHKNAAGIL